MLVVFLPTLFSQISFFNTHDNHISSSTKLIHICLSSERALSRFLNELSSKRARPIESVGTFEANGAEQLYCGSRSTLDTPVFFPGAGSFCWFSRFPHSDSSIFFSSLVRFGMKVLIDSTYLTQGTMYPFI